MMDFKKIEEKNQAMKSMDIKGKPYNTVNQRVLAFREIFPDGAIVTDILSDQDGKCIIKAKVYDGDKLISTGHAFENQVDRSSFVNKTSYIENCETSAIGRALGFLGIGATDSIASYEEVQNAVNAPAMATNVEKKTFMELCKKYNVDYKDIRRQAGQPDPKAPMTADEHGKCLLILKEIEEAQNEER